MGETVICFCGLMLAGPDVYFIFKSLLLASRIISVVLLGTEGKLTGLCFPGDWDNIG